MNKLPTIDLKGKKYVQVKDRIIFFNEAYPNGQITTSVKSAEGGKGAMVRFRAVVVPDITKPRKFTAHSFGTIDEVKAFEKLETVAVGRALALMGIGVLESIASADEMQRFEEKKAKPVRSVNHNVQICGDYEFGMMMKTGQFTTDSGMSKKTGKPFYIADFQGQRYWLTEEQYQQLRK